MPLSVLKRPGEAAGGADEDWGKGGIRLGIYFP